MRKRALSAVRAGYSVRRWMCAALLPYRALAYSADCPIAAAAYQFLRYRGSVQNENLAVFLLHRFVRELAVCCCVGQTDFLPYRIAEKQAKPDDLLLAARLPCLELAQRYCAAALFLYAQTASDLFLRCRQVVPDCAEWQTAMQDCLTLHLEQMPFRVLRVVYQAAAQRCCAAARIRAESSAPVHWCCDTIFLRHRPADWYCAADSMLLLFLLYRKERPHCDFALTRCCLDGIPTGNVRPVPAAYSA